MTITRPASAGRKHVARIAAASVALASVTALAVAGVAERASVADSFTVLGHLHGQPGSPADWQLVAGRLPAPLHAVATDRPGYGSSRLPAGGFAVNARAVLDDLDSHGIARAVLVGHSYGGGVALSAASLAPGRVAAVVLLASVGPGCLTGWDRLLAAPGAGQLCAQVAWRLTPWLARARLARITRQRAGHCGRTSMSTGRSGAMQGTDATRSGAHS